MDRLKNQKDFWALVIFTLTDFKFWRICLVNISVGMVKGVCVCVCFSNAFKASFHLGACMAAMVLRGTQQIPSQVVLAGLRVLEQEGQNPKSPFSKSAL